MIEIEHSFYPSEPNVPSLEIRSKRNMSVQTVHDLEGVTCVNLLLMIMP
jgi:hypothetical protein